MKLLGFIVVTMIILHGCSALLPSGKEVIRVPWNNYQEVQSSYNQVTPNVTTIHQLRKLGFDLYSTPNIKILNYLDIAAATQNIRNEDLGPGLARCIRARDNCIGYQFEPKVLKSVRYGNFWLDMLNFSRKTRGTGWKFKAVFLVIDDVVIEKFWDGNPMIVEERETNNPLGPFQEAAGGLLLRMF